MPERAVENQERTAAPFAGIIEIVTANRRSN
jgi:hypothetical protein